MSGSFDDQEIREGYDIVVYEIGDEFCQGISGCIGDEGFRVFLIEDFLCRASASSERGPEVELGESEGGESRFEVPAL